MGLAERADLTAELNLAGNFTRNLAGAQRAFGVFSKTLDNPRIGRGIAQIGTGLRTSALIAGAGIGVLASQVAAGLAQLVELESQTAQTNAVIKSTGGIAGVTATQVRALAEKYEGLNATIDDKAIQSTENLLLTFTSITKEGFEPALQAILDMNTAMGGGEEGLQGTAIMVGKALQDPIRGLTALRRVGVNFTKDQEKQIKALVETGDVMGAQKLILAELTKEFGGSFLAGGGTTAGKVAKFQDSIEDLQKALATALLPTVGKLADRLSGFLADPATIRNVEQLGEKIAGLFSDENIEKGAGLVREAFDTIKSALPGLKDAASITGQILSTAVGLFKSLPPDLQRLAIGALAVNKLTGGLVTNLAGGLLNLALGSLRTITAANVTVIGGTVTGPGGLPGTASKGGGLGGALKFLGGALLVTGTVALATEISGLLDPKHRTPEGEIFRGTNVASEQLAFQEAAAAMLRQRIAGGETGIVEKQLTAVETEIAKLRAEVAASDASSSVAQLTVQEHLASERADQRAAAQEAALGRAREAIVEQRRATDLGFAGATAASRATAAAIKEKDLNVTVNLSTSTTVTVRDNYIKARTYGNYGRAAGAV